MNGKKDNRMETDRERGGKKRDDTERAAIIRLVLTVIAAVFAVGAAVCIVCYIALKNDVLFIPFAVFVVIAMITFTYAKVK